ncbi:hypothetical protein HPP92_021822 [Vanilla planifolia]|uniref:Uncharacterized protein n=1 Tax=Vanilla planifolia TaxID=51239 RepID=A0A835PW95_VANPL|nr:hypothetical protein HPP92_021822 [Vanilla planifolia]
MLISYGSILMNLQSRGDVVVKIKGCIVDSGPAPEINPKIWAAGFCAALMKKNTCANISHELANGDTSCGNNKGGSKVDWKSSLLEIMTKFILERFFALFLFLPIVERKLGAVISVLSKNQPSCPQLYLYSSADRVIPASLVESFIKEQKSLGKAVRSYDFFTSSHVDHFRCFRRRYSAEVDGFLDCCCSESFCRESVSL